MEIFGCPDGNGCTYKESENICKTVFGPSIPGKIFEPTSLSLQNAVLTASQKAFGNYGFWIGVNVRDLTYKSNGKPVSINSIPWASRHSEEKRNSNSYCMFVYANVKRWTAVYHCIQTHS